jgi:spermidine/putrescine-binding protein
LAVNSCLETKTPCHDCALIPFSEASKYNASSSSTGWRKASFRAGFAADVMHPCNYSVSRFANAGLVNVIDTSKLSNRTDV